MEIDTKTSGYIEAGAAAGFAFMSWVKTATQKYEAYNAANVSLSYSIFAKRRIENALALMVGDPAVKALDPTYTGGVTQVFPNPIGALNTNTAIGAGLLVTDYILRNFVSAKYYKHLPVIPNLVRGTGIGVTIGGIIGGMWDPEPSDAYKNINHSQEATKPTQIGSITYTAE
jgi:hypothetical protein